MSWTRRSVRQPGHTSATCTTLSATRATQTATSGRRGAGRSSRTASRSVWRAAWTRATTRGCSRRCTSSSPRAACSRPATHLPSSSLATTCTRTTLTLRPTRATRTYLRTSRPCWRPRWSACLTWRRSASRRWWRRRRTTRLCRACAWRSSTAQCRSSHASSTSTTWCRSCWTSCRRAARTLPCTSLRRMSRSTRGLGRVAGRTRAFGL
mmetsp:Transcript_12962/g.31757  ORF Transcript_12962/g.31757 Transcript_12962/m.31757 type:complete len:209 (+) Transcript_12962:1086-1712(+)